MQAFFPKGLKKIFAQIHLVVFEENALQFRKMTSPSRRLSTLITS